MKTKLAKKSKLIIGIIIIILLLGIIGFVLWNNYFKQPKEISENKECETCTVKYSSEQISGYDYIIQEMNKAEYWDEDYLYEYLPKEDADEVAKTNPNGTGWYLSDAKTASFSRGSKNILTYNFSTFTAVLKDQDGIIWVYDFVNNTLQTYVYNEPDKIIDSRELITDYNDPITDTLYQCGSFDNFTSPYTEKIYKNSMLNYAYLFELAGCPILMQPEGTLESYKNKMINPIENYQKINMEYGDYYEARKAVVDYNGNPYADSSKIDGPWELEDYVYDLRKNNSIQWIDDYKKVANIAKELPEYIYEPDGYDASQASLVFVNKDYYDFIDEDMFKDGLYDNKTSNLFAYYIRPLLKEVYGKDVTYFYDEGDHNIPLLQPNNYDIGGYENAMQSWYPAKPDSSDTQVSVFRSPQSEQTGYIYYFHDIDNEMYEGYLEENFGCIDKLLIASNTTNIFSDIYKFNFMLTIDMWKQCMLGLR